MDLQTPSMPSGGGLMPSAQNSANYKEAGRNSNHKIPITIRVLMHHSGGLIDTERKANYVIVILSLVFLAASFYLTFGKYLKQVAAPQPQTDALEDPSLPF